MQGAKMIGASIRTYTAAACALVAVSCRGSSGVFCLFPPCPPSGTPTASPQASETSVHVCPPFGQDFEAGYRYRFDADACRYVIVGAYDGGP
ncbi:MAG: hypothetical protein ACHP7H_00745 [Hyphomicrobiales bacterium]